jgi:FlaA1/EpsC-like NDP-sugar epimerase
VILPDNNEGALYDLAQDLKSSKVYTFVTDVKDKDNMEPLFYGVDFVFHLAGPKNVSMCEYNPPMKLLKRISLGLTTWSIDVCERRSEK